GGFWAWDPVENASLVPWLTLVGAGHLMLIQRSKGVSVLSLFIFTCVSLILVQYSSFLTKSGILGETSVHSFTDLGMTGHLALCLIALVVLSVGLIISRYKEFPNAEKEESIWSREFWMFIGALILLISAFQIGYSTSFPVINKIFGTELATPSNVHEYYNRWQLPLAIIVALFVSVGQFLKYKSTDPKTLIKKLSVSLSLSIVLTLVFALSLEISNAFILGLTFTSSFAVLANLDYLLRILNGNLKKGGSSIAHVGFGLVLLGAVISTSQQEVISENTSLFDVTKLDDGFTNTENILLMKDDTLLMGTYFVSYRGKKKEGHFIHYQVDYLAQNSEGELDSVFSLFPFIQLNPRMGNVAEPYTKHYLDRDVYTYIAYAEIEDRKSEEKGSSHEIEVGDTIFSRSSFIVLDSLNRFPNREGSNLREKDMALGASFSVYDVNTEKHLMEPLFVIRDRRLTFSVPDSVRSAGIKVFFDGIDPEKQKFKFRLLEQDDAKKEFIVMKAIVFPYINILWLGCILMALGSFLAVFNRIRKK
ncbi:MAG: cytochrome C biogenesis protein, partial [Bacteroidetes bacterium]|nr:cytochrome C biogenesis protein [Bacteroidota bacterium]